MARPRVPLISKRRALEVALDIIDTEGIGALSIRHLAQRLKVNGASLYHHFENKDEIVVGATRLALEDVRTPVTGTEPWRVWLLRINRTARRAMCEHPDLVQVMLRLGPLQLGLPVVDKTVELLKQEGVPIGAIVPMLETLESYSVVSALIESARGDDIAPLPPQDSTPNLNEALYHRALASDEVFDKVCGLIIDTMVSAAAERAASTPIGSVARRRRTPTRRTSANKASTSKKALPPRKAAGSTKSDAASKTVAALRKKPAAKKTSGNKASTSKKALPPRKAAGSTKSDAASKTVAALRKKPAAKKTSGNKASTSKKALPPRKAAGSTKSDAASKTVAALRRKPAAKKTSGKGRASA